jgi:hypothetical protein
MSKAKELEPLHLIEMEDAGARFLIYNTDRGVKTELRFEEEQPWFSQAQLAQIFGVDVRTVSDQHPEFLSDAELE